MKGSRKRLSIIIGCLFVTLAQLLAQLAAAQPFHTDPACWDAPRVFHAGPPTVELARRIERTPAVVRTPTKDALSSPNGAYQVWVEVPGPPTGNVADQILYVDSEQGRVTRFYLEQAHLRVTPRWINEKLVFARVVWGREVFTDIIIDAESGELLYQEEARGGRNAYEQYQQACRGTCPCDPGAIDRVDVPPSIPAAGEAVGLVSLAAPGAIGLPLPVYIDNGGSRVAIATLSDPAMIETDRAEEQPSALVFSVESGWYQIRMKGEAGRLVWIRASDVGEMTSMPEVLTARLAYLNQHWDGRLWKSPDGSNGFTVSDIKSPGLAHEEYAASFSRVTETGSGTWLYVRLHGADSCDRSSASVVAEGWIPAWSAQGRLVGGYYARGC